MSRTQGVGQAFFNIRGDVLRAKVRTRLLVPRSVLSVRLEQDPEVIAAFDAFDATKNVTALVYALNTIVNM